MDLETGKPVCNILWNNQKFEYKLFDTVQNSKKKSSIFIFGLGGGACFPGISPGLNLALLSQNLWGRDIRLNINMYKSKNVPDDYYDDGARVIAPKDYINTVSFNLMKLFHIRNKGSIFGFESGPSLCIYRQAEFELNPDYTTDEEASWWFSTYKYYKSHPRRSTIGGSLRVKFEFTTNDHSGLELAAFTDINKFHTISGFEIYVLFGGEGYNK